MTSTLRWSADACRIGTRAGVICSAPSAHPRPMRWRAGHRACARPAPMAQLVLLHCRTTGGNRMHKLTIGDVTITSIIERDRPWRTPEDMLPAYDPAVSKRHLAELDPVVFDPASGKMVITYQ